MPPPFPAPQAVQRRLLRWFDRHQRDLPWRKNRHPYRVWVAEIMLQQTRVPVVIPYYLRFLQAFPTIRDVANASEEQVLKLWAGLGYYQRARHLHQAARTIIRHHAGRFPRTLKAALALPGIGPYTARAILSIAWNRPLAVVDGNVARVLTRLYQQEQCRPGDRRRLQPLADRLVPHRRPGDFNQALMEIGSTLCLPKNPRCQCCPLEAVCLARRSGVEQTILPRRVRRPRPRRRLNVLVVRRQGRLLLVREPSGLFSGLWCFPSARDGRMKELARALGARQLRPVASLVHETTMRELLLRVYVGNTDRRAPPLPGTPQRWIPPSQVANLGVGAATRKVLAALHGQL